MAGVRTGLGVAIGLFQFGDAALCLGELVFEFDDSDGGGQGHVLVKQLTDAGGEGEFGAGVAALTAGGAFKQITSLSTR